MLRALFHGAYSKAFPLNLVANELSTFLNAFSWCRRVWIWTSLTVDDVGDEGRAGGKGGRYWPRHDVEGKLMPGGRK